MYDVRHASIYNYVLIIIVICMVYQNSLKTDIFKLYNELQAISHDTIGIHFINNMIVFWDEFILF